MNVLTLTTFDSQGGMAGMERKVEAVSEAYS